MVDLILNRLTTVVIMGHKEGDMQKFLPKAKVSIIVDFLREARSRLRVRREEPIPSTSKTEDPETDGPYIAIEDPQN